MSDHVLLLSAFEAIEDKNALAWSVLDTKSELAVTAAIALSANRRANARIAHVEYPPRVDLVINGSEGRPSWAYQAKALYLNDFQQRHRDRKNPFLGAHFDRDLAGLPEICKRLAAGGGLGPMVRGAGLFYLYEIADCSKQLKYHDKDRDQNVALEVALDHFSQSVNYGIRNHMTSIDCGVADGTAVRIHLLVFDLCT